MFTGAYVETEAACCGKCWLYSPKRDFSVKWLYLAITLTEFNKRIVFYIQDSDLISHCWIFTKDSIPHAGSVASIHN